MNIVILAAGSSSRMGDQIKQLLLLDGKPLLTHTIERAKKLESNRIVVVLGAYAEEIQLATMDSQVDFVINPNWKEGMGSSLAKAIRTVESDKADAPDAVLVLLADQPLIVQDDECLRSLIAKWQTNPDKICASDYGSKLGVPCIFPNRYFAQLSQINGDAGARELLNDQRENILSIPIGYLARDIDTLEDYEQVLKLWREKSK